MLQALRSMRISYKEKKSNKKSNSFLSQAALNRQILKFEKNTQAETP